MAGLDYRDDWYDDQTQGNWGLITPRDDPYDGRADTPGAGTDAFGFYTGCQGDALPGPATPCEHAGYGDYLDTVTSANPLWLSYVPRKTKTVSGGVAGMP